MFKKAILELVISDKNEKLVNAIYNALDPETKTPSPGCIIELSKENLTKLILIIKCSRINMLRALHNSFLSTISMLLHVYNEVIKA
ncbi:hypothetical protein Smar_0863 [Staphylothermus marinus F1]|uniref:Uncharacterized protein n=1 Tax=Staphylothermus marinus (strain ATCC 43588 / DSM 3639 / JCM 9404 / F1) TaxID=399550 RepID=A3DMV3_STAMF|nr:KEOPS complex subunit Pcc1 [Staphylothermus marinus]ABN69963.1 hypothetical protein Smar_0863 [Staphylothermus marinus F1]